MVRLIKQIVIGIFIGLFLLMAVIFGYFYFNQDKIVKLLIDEVNRNVNTRVDVNDVKMSFWERFPQISIKFEDITIHNATGYKSNTEKKLLAAEYVFFDLDLKTLISDKPQINKIVIGPGELNLLVDRNNNSNYKILKSSEEGGGQLEIGNLETENLKIAYENLKDRNKESLVIKKANVSINIHKQKSNFDVKLTILKPTFIPVQYQKFDEYGFVGNLSLSGNEVQWIGFVSADDLVIENKGTFSIDQQSLLAEINNVSLESGLVSKGIQLFDLPLKSENARVNISTANISLSNNRFLVTLEYDVDGTFDINKNFHSVILSSSGSMILNNYDLRILFDVLKIDKDNSNLNFKGEYNSQKNRVSGDLSFHVDLADFRKTLEQYKVENPRGILDGHFKLNNRASNHLNIFDFNTGEVGLTNVSFNLKNNYLSIEDVQSLLCFSEDEIMIEELNGVVNNNDIAYKGKTTGLQKYLFSDGSLDVRGTVSSKEFFLSEFLYASSDSQSETLQLGEKLNLQLKVNVNEIRNNNFRGDNLSLNLIKKAHEVQIRNFTISTSEGYLTGDGILAEQANGEWYTTINANIDQLQISEFFASMNDFGQQFIVSDNLKGKLSAGINADFVFTPHFEIKPESIYLDANLEIDDGELINYKMLEELSDFISIDELRHIKFETLRNRITIHNKKIIIPQMQVNSSAIDIGIIGEHGFDDNINYQISVGLTDVLFGKIPRRLRKDSKRQKNKKLTLYVDVSGNIEDPEVTLSKIMRDKVIRKDTIEEKKKKFNIEFDDL